MSTYFIVEMNLIRAIPINSVLEVGGGIRCEQATHWSHQYRGDPWLCDVIDGSLGDFVTFDDRSAYEFSPKVVAVLSRQREFVEVCSV